MRKYFERIVNDIKFNQTSSRAKPQIIIIGNSDGRNRKISVTSQSIWVFYVEIER